MSRGPVHIHIACGTGPVYIHLDTSTPLERKVTGGSYPRQHQPRQEHVPTFNLPLTVPEYGAHRAPSPFDVDFEDAHVPHYFEGGRT